MDIATFISEIYTRPALWQSGHHSHKNKNITHRLWEEIHLQYPSLTVGDLKKKWKSLRDNYTREFKKIPKSTNVVDYEPTWKYFPQLGFLKDEMSTDSKLDEGNNEISNEIIVIEDKNVAKKRKLPSPTRSLSPIVQSEPARSTGFNHTQNDRKKRQMMHDIRVEYLEIEKKKLKLLEDDISRNIPLHSGAQQKSDDYHFLMSILPEMEKLPALQKFRLRNKINQAILDELTTKQGEPNTTRPPTNSIQQIRITNVKSESYKLNNSTGRPDIIYNDD